MTRSGSSRLLAVLLQGEIMAKIYLSSTYRDLQGHRKAVYEQLHRMKHAVTAMEDYVAQDERPADKCVADVVTSDLYIGVLAWRYGYVPTGGNAESLSITEMEHRAAIANKIPALMFLLDEAAAWPPGFLDSHTNEGERGERIGAFRKRVSEERLASFFTSPEDLAAKVAAAVHVAGTVAAAKDVSFDLASLVGQDAIDRPEFLFNQSYLPYLVQQIGKLGDSPLMKIDLRDGTYWWSTRLYALATLADEYTAVDWILFVEHGDDYVGMMRPGELRRALAAFQPELEEHYRLAHVPPMFQGMDAAQRAAQVLGALVERFASHEGGEEGLRFLVDAAWLARNAGSLSRAKVERAGPFDPLATYELLRTETPYVPITHEDKLLKVIDRNGVATALALGVIQRQLGRA